MTIQIQEQRNEWGFAISTNDGHRADWDTMTIEQRDEVLMMLLGCYNYLNQHLTDPVIHQRTTTNDTADE